MKKILNLFILYSCLLTLHLLKLYSHKIVLEIYSYSDISVHFYTVWLFRVWEHIASTLTARVVDRKAHIVNSKCFCASAVLHSSAEGCATWAFSSLDQKGAAMLSFPKAVLSANSQGWVSWNSFGLPFLKEWHGLQSAGLCLCSGEYSVSSIHRCFGSRRIFVLLCSPLLWHLDQASALILAGSQKYSYSYLVLLSWGRRWRSSVSALSPLGVHVAW